jgi:hypothetical protein
MPANERLARRDFSGLEIDEGLIVEDELAVRQRLTEIEFKRTPLLHASVHFRFEKSIGISAVGLAAVERRIGVPHELIWLNAVGRRDCDADAGPHHDLVAVELIWCADRFDQTCRKHGRVRGPVDWGLYDRKLVAA